MVSGNTVHANTTNSGEENNWQTCKKPQCRLPLGTPGNENRLVDHVQRSSGRADPNRIRRISPAEHYTHPVIWLIHTPLTCSIPGRAPAFFAPSSCPPLLPPPADPPGKPPTGLLALPRHQLVPERFTQPHRLHRSLGLRQKILQGN